jgi:hypothetical protein
MRKAHPRLGLFAVVSVSISFAALTARADGEPTTAAPLPPAEPPAVSVASTQLPVGKPDADRGSAASSRRRIWGLSMDLGVPDGAAIGLTVLPRDWLRLDASITYGGIAPGGRLGVTLEPFAWMLAPTLSAEGGHCFGGAIPGVQSISSVSYSYANFHAGLELGGRSSLRFFLRAGVSYLDATMAVASSAAGPSSVHLAGLSYDGWIVPSAKVGLSQYF